MRHIVPAVIVVAMLFGAGVWGFAQVMPTPTAPVVLSGNDIGFRMVARRGEKAVGQLVVKVDGQWVEAEWTMRAVPVVK